MLEGEVKIKNEIALNLINLGISLDYISRATSPHVLYDIYFRIKTP